MAHTKKQTLIEETTVSEPDNSPSVVAYRVGQLEKAVNAGFEKQTEALKDIVDGFVTEKEMIEAKTEADKEHVRIWKEIDRIKSWGVWAVRIIGAALILGILFDLGLKAGIGG